MADTWALPEPLTTSSLVLFCYKRTAAKWADNLILSEHFFFIFKKITFLSFDSVPSRVFVVFYNLDAATLSSPKSHRRLCCAHSRLGVPSLSQFRDRSCAINGSILNILADSQSGGSFLNIQLEFNCKIHLVGCLPSCLFISQPLSCPLNVGLVLGWT